VEELNRKGEGREIKGGRKLKVEKVNWKQRRKSAQAQTSGLNTPSKGGHMGESTKEGGRGLNLEKKTREGKLGGSPSKLEVLTGKGRRGEASSDRLRLK